MAASTAICKGRYVDVSFFFNNTLFFTDPTRASTLLLTGLMVIGLGFFIRASTKDRIEIMRFGSAQAAEPLQQEVLNYFRGRAYHSLAELKSGAAAPKGNAVSANTADDATDAVTVIGMVSPSVFMAVFLSSLALVGFACLALIVAVLLPSWGPVAFGLVVLSPLAGVFYWRKSSRPEEVTFKVEPATDSGVNAGGFKTKLTVQGHRDELAELRNAFSEALSAWE